MKRISLFAALMLAAAALQSAEIPENILRIAIAEDAASFNLGADKGFEIFDLNGGQKRHLEGRSIYLVKPDAGGVSIGEAGGGNLLRAMAAEGDFLRINGRRYRGTILIRKSGPGKITAINELGIDEYLCGILPREVSPSWPMESLKAQAVVSRSFALKNLVRHNSAGFNLCSTVHCQVYGGMEGEDPRTNQAVEETYNEVVLYADDLANTLFFSNCGGKTEYPSNAWDSKDSPAYLKPVSCKYCRSFKHHQWDQQVSGEQLARALSKFRIEAPVHSCAVSGTDKSGRAVYIKIKHAGGTDRVRANQFRMAMGPNVIRSTLLTSVKKKGGGFYFKGKGWGHGVGMCQEGARGMAESGKNYKKIVRFYYPGTRIEKVEDE